MPTPLDDLADLEAAFRALFFGRFRGGIFGRVRSVPREILAVVDRGDARSVLGSDWWRSIWGLAVGLQVVDVDGRPIGAPHQTEAQARAAAGAHRVELVLAKISREAGGAAWRELHPEPREPSTGTATGLGALVALALSRKRRRVGLPESRARELAVAIARERAAELVRELQASTGDALRQAVADVHGRGLKYAELKAELEARLGPTRKQMRSIRAWEAKQRAAGVPRRKILTGLRSRTRNAVRARADGIAAWEFVKMAKEARMGVFEDEGMLVYSENQHDERVRKLHRKQTAVTLGHPVPAGQPWPAEAPFHEGPPYEAGCRCYPVPKRSTTTRLLDA